MFKNIGKKIKFAAMILCWAGIIGSIIGGIITWVVIYNEIGGLYFALISVFGSLFSWVSSLFIFGFGELVEKTSNIEKAVNNKTEQ